MDRQTRKTPEEMLTECRVALHKWRAAPTVVHSDRRKPRREPQVPARLLAWAVRRIEWLEEQHAEAHHNW